MLNRRDLIAASAAVPILGMPPAVLAAPATAPATSGEDMMPSEIDSIADTESRIPVIGIAYATSFTEGREPHIVTPGEDVVLGMLCIATALQQQFPGWKLECVADDYLCHTWAPRGHAYPPPRVLARTVTISVISEEHETTRLFHSPPQDGAFVLSEADVEELTAVFSKSESPASSDR